MKDMMIYDVGMNTGQDTAYYLHMGCKVIAIEANPILAAQCASRFKKEIAEGRLVIENVGISDNPGVTDFWICDDKSEWSSFDLSCAARRGYRHHSVPVPCATLPTLIRKYGIPYYIKIDIEGHDRICLSQLTKQLSPAYISIESYGHGEEPILDLLSLGYSKFKILDQVCFRTLEEPATFSYIIYWKLKQFHYQSQKDKQAYISRLIGKFGGRVLASRIMRQYRSCHGFFFEDGASGPFSNDLPGHWITATKSINTIKRFIDWQKKNPQDEYSRWFDIHAKK